MPYFFQSEVKEMNDLWRERRNAVFQKAVVDRFVADMVKFCHDRDLVHQMFDAIKHAKKASDLWVTAGRCYEPNYRFTEADYPGMWLSIKQLIYRTDALSQLADELGSCIKIRPLYQDDVIFLKIEFWAAR